MLALEGSATPVARLFARVYRGEVLRIKQHPAAVQLASCARRCLASRLGCAEAELIDSSNPDFENAAAAACDDFACSPEAAALWAEVVQSVSGVAAEAMYWDKYKLRVQPTEQHAAEWDKRVLLNDNPTKSELPLHRDTWGSCCSSQINWWLPVCPVDLGRTLEIFPTVFQTPVGNTSSKWQVRDFVKWKKAARSGEVVEEYPSLPSACDEGVDAIATGTYGDGLRVVVDPGDVVVFSAAHLHRSVPNRTARHRFSTEVRTLHLPDVIRSVGAPDVDGSSGKPKLQWFWSMANGPVDKASDAVAAATYI